MKIAKRYLLDNLSSLFISIFLPLFGVASIVFLIKLASYTAIIDLSFLDMGELFLFMLPELLFYTIPISFFVALVLTLFKLSSDNEMVVFFSLGVKPSFIIKTFLTPSLILSALLVFDYFVLFPHAKTLSHNFLSYKKSEAKFNLSASEFGHKFGDWLLYLAKENKDGSYEDAVLFNKKQPEEIFIESKKAEVINDGGVLKLKLSDGKGYSYSKEKLTQTDFETMYINDTMQTSLEEHSSPLEYWFLQKDSKKTKSFNINTLIALFVPISMFLTMSIGIINSRHQKSRVYLYLFSSIIIYYTLAILLEKYLSYYAIAVVVFGWMALTFTLYKNSVAKRF
ncbi:MAG: LptF/LptG family permease [Sulfurimonadaceae bacterium]|jgi:lipopolysaccharide export system permease protein|nr:LptF/LptG family permease [Sulfurimonadaceae bacterium]